MDISMDISMDLSMDIHIHGKPGFFDLHCTHARRIPQLLRTKNSRQRVLRKIPPPEAYWIYDTTRLHIIHVMRCINLGYIQNPYDKTPSCDKTRSKYKLPS